MLHSRVGVTIRGSGTNEEPCLAVSQPLWLSYGVTEVAGRPATSSRLVTYWFRERWISTWLFSRELLETGYLDLAFSDPVRLALRGTLDLGYLDACMYAIPFMWDEPKWIDLGPQIRFADELRYNGDPRKEVADLLMSRMQGNPTAVIEELIAFPA